MEIEMHGHELHLKRMDMAIWWAYSIKRVCPLGVPNPISVDSVNKSPFCSVKSPIYKAIFHGLWLTVCFWWLSHQVMHRSSGRTLRVPSDAIERSLWGSQGNWWAVLGIKKNNPFLVASMGACQKNRHSGHPTPFDRVDVARRWWTAQAMQMSCGPAELPLLMLGREKRWSEAYYNLGVSYAEMHKYDKAQMRPSTRDNQAQVTRIFRQTSIHAGWIWVNSWRFIVQKDVVSVFSEFLKLPKIAGETPNIKRLALLEKALL